MFLEAEGTEEGRIEHTVPSGIPATGHIDSSVPLGANHLRVDTWHSLKHDLERQVVAGAYHQRPTAVRKRNHTP